MAGDLASLTARITILTGPIHSGKTTRLAAWIAARREAGETIDGILAPIVDGRRHLCAIATGASRCLEADADRTGAEVRIGPHRFDGEVFAWARRHLAAAVAGDAGGDGVADGAEGGGSATGARWVVVDEVGPLELRGEGLEPVVRAAVAAAGGAFRLVLVVREALVERVKEHYRLPDDTVEVVRA